jgi:Ca2+-binding RTX toxin-like protein
MPKQSTNTSGNPIGIVYTANGQTWTVPKGVDVSGTTGGVFSGYVNSVLKNNGSIFGPSYGALFVGGGAASNYVVKNQKKGDISGSSIGVGMIDFVGSALIQNKGKIEGSSYALYVFGYQGSAKIVNEGNVKSDSVGIHSRGSSNVSIENYKNVYGDLIGIEINVTYPVAKGPLINNYGKIEASQVAIYISSDTGSTAKIVNHKGGVIDGSMYAIISGEKLNLKNEGKIEGLVATSSHADKVINKGNIKGNVALGDGNDVFKIKGDKAKAGMIDMGRGNDLVVLGKKADKLLFDSALNAATNVDTVKKFQSGKDKMYLDEDIFTAIAPGTLSSAAFHKGTSAADADDRIIYDKKTGALYYDPDGAGGVAQTQFAKLDKGTKLKASDFMVGEYSTALIV